MVLTQLRISPQDEQRDPAALTHWRAFSDEFPEVCDKHIFFATTRDRYAHAQEVTACYGTSYKRAYASKRGGATAMVDVQVPPDTYSAEDLANAEWPLRVPGWFNPDMQPLLRPALRRAIDANVDVQCEEHPSSVHPLALLQATSFESGSIEVVYDQPWIVRARILRLPGPAGYLGVGDHALHTDMAAESNRVRGALPEQHLMHEATTRDILTDTRELELPEIYRVVSKIKVEGWQAMQASTQRSVRPRLSPPSPRARLTCSKSETIEAP